MKDKKIIEQIEEVIVEPEEKTEEAVEVEAVVKGKVTDCIKLNVRRGALITSDIIEVIEEGAIVEINENISIDYCYFFFIYILTKVFCM